MTILIIADWVNLKQIGYRCPFCVTRRYKTPINCKSGSLGKIEDHITNKVLHCCGKNADVHINDKTKRI